MFLNILKINAKLFNTSRVCSSCTVSGFYGFSTFCGHRYLKDDSQLQGYDGLMHQRGKVAYGQNTLQHQGLYIRRFVSCSDYVLISSTWRLFQVTVSQVWAGLMAPCWPPGQTERRCGGPYTGSHNACAWCLISTHVSLAGATHQAAPDFRRGATEREIPGGPPPPRWAPTHPPWLSPRQSRTGKRPECCCLTLPVIATSLLPS